MQNIQLLQNIKKYCNKSCKISKYCNKSCKIAKYCNKYCKISKYCNAYCKIQKYCNTYCKISKYCNECCKISKYCNTLQYYWSSLDHTTISDDHISTKLVSEIYFLTQWLVLLCWELNEEIIFVYLTYWTLMWCNIILPGWKYYTWIIHLNYQKYGSVSTIYHTPLIYVNWITIFIRLGTINMYPLSKFIYYSYPIVSIT